MPALTSLHRMPATGAASVEQAGHPRERRHPGENHREIYPQERS